MRLPCLFTLTREKRQDKTTQEREDRGVSGVEITKRSVFTDGLFHFFGLTVWFIYIFKDRLFISSSYKNTIHGRAVEIQSRQGFSRGGCIGHVNVKYESRR